MGNQHIHQSRTSIQMGSPGQTRPFPVDSFRPVFVLFVIFIFYEEGFPVNSRIQVSNEKPKGKLLVLEKHDG